MIWKTLLGSLQPLLWILLAFLFIAVMGWVPDRTTAKVRADGVVEFGWNWPVAAIGILFLLWLGITVADFLKQGFTDPWNDLVVFFVTLCGFAIVAELPGTILVNSEGLEQIYWFRRNKLMFWVEVDEIDTGYKSRMVTVTGSGRTRVIHSALLVDRARFLFEIKYHFGDKLPPEFPREPGSTA